MDAVKHYKMMELAKKQMLDTCDAWGVPHKMAKDIRITSRHNLDVLKDYFDTETSQGFKVYGAFYDYVDDLMGAISSYRNSRSLRETYNPMGKHKVLTKDQARSTLGEFFPRSNTDVHIATSSKEVGTEQNNPKSSWNKSTDIMVSISWYRAVFQRGLAIINSSKGKRFVLSAKPIDVKYCQEEGMTVYRVTAVAFKNGLGTSEIGYLCTYGDTSQYNPAVATADGKDAIPHSYSDTVTKAYKLLRQRAVRNMTKMFNT